MRRTAAQTKDEVLKFGVTLSRPHPPNSLRTARPHDPVHRGDLLASFPGEDRALLGVGRPPPTGGAVVLTAAPGDTVAALSAAQPLCPPRRALSAAPVCGSVSRRRRASCACAVGAAGWRWCLPGQGRRGPGEPLYGAQVLRLLADGYSGWSTSVRPRWARGGPLAAGRFNWRGRRDAAGRRMGRGRGAAWAGVRRGSCSALGAEGLGSVPWGRRPTPSAAASWAESGLLRPGSPEHTWAPVHLPCSGPAIPGHGCSVQASGELGPALGSTSLPWGFGVSGSASHLGVFSG